MCIQSYSIIFNHIQSSNLEGIKPWSSFGSRDCDQQTHYLNNDTGCNTYWWFWGSAAMSFCPLTARVGHWCRSRFIQLVWCREQDWNMMPYDACSLGFLNASNAGRMVISYHWHKRCPQHPPKGSVSVWKAKGSGYRRFQIDTSRHKLGACVRLRH